jgi:hypothetical protein
MSERHELLPGSFCWPELGTPDAGKAKGFYSGLFGWEAVDVPSAGGTYAFLKLRGLDVAALRLLSDREKAQRVPAHWMTYISTASAEASAARAKELGGTVLAGPFDVEGIGRMAVVRDPEGAVFALWEAGGHIGARIVGEPGSLCWTELSTRNPAGAQAFYGGLFGWRTKTAEGAAADYIEIYREEQPIGGFLQMKAQAGAAPAHWMPYFQVESCDATAARARELGGGVTVPPMDMENVGRFAVLHDANGAHFSVIAVAPMPGSA